MRINTCLQKLKTQIDNERIIQNELMKKHTTFQIGGPVDIFVIVKTIKELQEVLKIAKEEEIPYYIVGNGSNLLVLDKGIRGMVIHPDFREVSLQQGNEEDVFFLEVGASLDIKEVSQIALEHSLTGLEFACGIPGSVGGAVRMNAGAYGGEMKDIIYSTKCMDEQGNQKELINNMQDFRYRHSIFYDEKYIIIATKLKLKKGNQQEIKQKMEENDFLRAKNQPLEMPSAGSTFKRGEGYLTSLLIEQARLKGFSIGDAAISEKHGGFVVNKGNATAKEVLELVDYVKKEIKKRNDVDIMLEVEIVGE